MKAVFDDIRRVRGSEFVNNFWRALANDAANLKRTWENLKVIMGGDGALDPLTRELIYIAVSATTGCPYCIHSHTAAAKQKGMTDAQHMHLLAIIGMASETNNLVNAMQVPVDREFSWSMRCKPPSFWRLPTARAMMEQEKGCRTQRQQHAGPGTTLTSRPRAA